MKYDNTFLPILSSLTIGVAVYCRFCKTFCLKLHTCLAGRLHRNHQCFAPHTVSIQNYSHTSPFGNNISHTQSLLHFQIIQEGWWGKTKTWCSC